MSFDITNILSKFSRTQRITALILLLIASVAIALGPSLIKSFAPDNSALHHQIKLQRGEIDSLNTALFNQGQTIIQLNRSIINNQQECTNAMAQREAEVVSILRQAKGMLQTPPVVHNSYKMSSYSNDTMPMMMMSHEPVQPNNEEAVKVLDNLITKIRKH